MRYETAPCRLLIWLAAAAAGWAVLLGTVVLLPEALAGFAVAGLLLWRKGQRPVPLTVPAEFSVAAAGAAPRPATVPTNVPATVPATVPAGSAASRSRDEVRHLVAHPV